MYKVLLLGEIDLIQQNWQIKQIKSLGELEQDTISQYDFVLINNTDGQTTLKQIQELRNEYNYWGAIGCIGAKSPHANFYYSSNMDFMPLVELTKTRAQLINDVTQTDEIHSVIKYLFIFQDSGLQLIQQVKQDKIYHSVIEDIFGIERRSYINLTEELQEFNLVQNKEYLDSALACNNCNSELLKFNDTCPNCHSSNVANSKFIHCFKCGHVESEDKFIRDNQLICPNCTHKLLLIGNDYDHPLDTTKCRSCGEIFIDSQIKIECLTCHHIHTETSQLVKYYYFNYQLRKDSDNKFISYLKDEVLYLFDKLNYTSKEYFQQLLEWMLKLFQRHDDESFNIIKLDLNFASGEINLRVLAEKFKNTLRTTDLFCRLGLTQILILFPKTEEDNGKILLDRIDKIIHSVIGEGKDSIQIQQYTAKQILATELNKLWFEK